MSNDPGQLPSRQMAPPMTAYIAVAIVAVFFVLMGFGAMGDLGTGIGGLLLRIGSLVLAAGLILVAVAVYNRNRPGRLPGIAEDSISFNIERLKHRRDMLRTAWLWMLAPLVPGMALLYAGAAYSDGIEPLWAVLGALLSAAALVAIAAFNTRVAKSLDPTIADLEKERGPR